MSKPHKTVSLTDECGRKVEVSHCPVDQAGLKCGRGLGDHERAQADRIEALSQGTQGRMTAASAANLLGLSRRQVHRLRKAFQSGGPAAIRHKARGRRSNNRIDPALHEFAVALVRENNTDSGTIFAAETLAEDHDLKLPRETLRKWMRDAGICDMEAANAFFPGVMVRYNARFAKVLRPPDNLHRALNIGPNRLRDVFCFRPSRRIAMQSPAGQWIKDMSASS